MRPDSTTQLCAGKEVEFLPLGRAHVTLILLALNQTDQALCVFLLGNMEWQTALQAA